jgi:hypothetical protein
MTKLNEVAKSQARIVSYLLVSGGLGYVFARYVANDPALTAIFAPAINYILYLIEKEVKREGFIDAIKSEK